MCFRSIPDYLACFVVSFPIVIETLLHGFDPHVTFYLCCKCATFLCTCIHCNAMKRTLRSDFYRGIEKIVMNNHQL